MPPGAMAASPLQVQEAKSLLVILSIPFSFHCFMLPPKKRGEMTDGPFLSSCLQDGMYKCHWVFPSVPQSALGEHTREGKGNENRD